jgi:hypothetical protein
MAADIQIIVETIGSESVLEATKRIGKLDRGAKSLYNSFKKGLITNHQAIKGLYELAEANKTAHASAKANYTALTPYVNAIMKLSNEQRKASKATKAAAASERVYSSSLNNSAAAARNAGLAVNHLGVQATRAQVKTKRFASVGLQQVGYQVGDFAVQVQGGTNALVALGQQGSQLLGILGPMGAIAGAALAIWTAIARVNQETSDTAILWDKVWSDLKKSVEPVSGILEGMSDALNAVGNAFISFANLVLNNMERIVVYASILVGVIGVKLTKAFIVSGRAAVVFGKMVKGAIASTGIGLFVVGLGEAYIKLAELVRGFKQSQEAMLKYGSVWVLVWTAMKEVFLQIPTALSYVVAG